jgi:endo-1,4-beta-xylanase
VPGVFAGTGAATLYFDNFTKHPAYDGVVEALKNKTKDKDGKNKRDMMSRPLFE